MIALIVLFQICLRRRAKIRDLILLMPQSRHLIVELHILLKELRIREERVRELVTERSVKKFALLEDFNVNLGFLVWQQVAKIYGKALFLIFFVGYTINNSIAWSIKSPDAYFI